MPQRQLPSQSTKLIHLSTLHSPPASRDGSSRTAPSIHAESASEQSISDGGSFHALNVAPTDGKEACVFLCAAFVVEMLVWGFPTSYGVLLDAYQESTTFAGGGDSDLLPLTGQLSSGLMYLLGPFVFVILQRWPEQRKILLWFGAVLCPASLVASAFATSPAILLLCQGILHAIGGALMYYNAQLILYDWFVRRRGLAIGICFAGTAAGGLFLPFILTGLLSAFSIKTTLIALGIGFGIIYACAIPFLRTRTDKLPPRTFGFGPDTRRSLMRKTVWLFLCVNTLQATGFFLPALWLPSFASALGLSSSQGTSTVAGLNGAAVASRVLLGFLSDTHSPHLLACATTFGASASVYLAWGVGGTAFAPLLVFSLIYGALAGGFTSLWSAAIREFAKDDPQSNATLFGLLSLTRGIGNVIGAPLSTALQRSRYPGRDFGFGVGGGLYGAIILFAGSSFAAAGLLETTQIVRKRRE